MESVIAFFMTIPFIGLLFKLFVIVLGIIYVFYSVLIYGQVTSLRKTVVTEHGDLIQFVSTIQIVVALAVLVISLLY
ncbi:hypothetical protein KBB12_04520 [Candidatus Woesebacteria bacterium]|nr:hypothetical protein [Candidatus Woesebacteria bacterium]